MIRYPSEYFHFKSISAYVIMLSSAKHLLKIFEKNKKCTHVISQNIKVISNLSTTATAVEEKRVNVDGININYVKIGVGEHAVLFLPGVMGSIWTDFKPQIENFKKEKLTIIAWDPPGYGKSRPPDKTFPKNFYRRDATWACNLMKTLGFDKFSLMGWSDGGNTSLILAAMYTENVRKMITIGAHSYITPGEMEIYEKIRNINNWSERIRAPLVAIYGEKYFQDTWNSWVDAYRLIFEHNNGDISKGYLNRIKCPSLIVHGEKDAMSFKEHADYLHANIRNSRLEIFKAGAHDLHLKYIDEFNALSYKFLVEQENSKLN